MVIIMTVINISLEKSQREYMIQRTKEMRIVMETIHSISIHTDT